MNKILIFSEKDDLSTSRVIEYIKHIDNEVEVLRLSPEIVYENLFIKSAGDFIDKCVSTSIKSFWYRRSSFIRKNVSEFLEDECKKIYEYIYMANQNRVRLNKPEDSRVNKLFSLEKAKDFGLNVPDYIITNKKSELLDFFNAHDKIITKAIHISPTREYKNHIEKFFTAIVEKEDIERLGETFDISFFQKYIEKKYEIRSFFLKDDFFSMAIFSQSNTKTSIDFRNYDRKTPNRTVPYVLPENITNKLIEFNSFFDYNSGSFDIIYTPEGEWYLLEINPIGQFGMVSYPCNYFIEEKIAQYLTNYE